MKFVSSAKEAAEYTKVISHTHALKFDFQLYVEANGVFPESLTELAQYRNRDLRFIEPPFGVVRYEKPSEFEPEDTIIYEANYRGKKVLILKNFTRVDVR